MPRGGSSFGSSSQGRVLGSGKREREEQEDDEVTFLGEGSQVATQSSQVDKDKETPPPEDDEHYVTLRTAVVGIQYYRGLVGMGEYVMLRREPTNRYDKNAIQVMNAGGVQVGHIPAVIAAKLAWMMDASLVTVEGRMAAKNTDGAMHYKLAMDMSIYARPSLRSGLEPELVWATPGQRGFEAMRQGLTQEPKPPSGKGKGRGPATVAGGSGGSGEGLPGARSDAEMQKLLDGLKRVGEDEKQADSVMDSFTGDIDVSKLPLHPSPPGLESGELLVDLLPHQSQALQASSELLWSSVSIDEKWMIKQEDPKLPSAGDPAVQFWIRQKADPKKGGQDYWLNVATKTPQKNDPRLGRGGILADGMGLGKTLSVLSLALATKSEKPVAGTSNATLIGASVSPSRNMPLTAVCPLSVLSNWEKQIKDHVTFGGLTSYTYHGEGKGVTATTLQQYDVVLTTYQTIAGEASTETVSVGKSKKAKKTAGPLFTAKWKRVVADEGHVLKNPKAKMTLAFAALSAERRWVCTGTPIVNSLADLGSILTCLQLCAPLDKAEYFKSLLLRPVKNGDPAAGKLLQALVGQILLRRTKDSKDATGKKLVDLPPIEYFQAEVELDVDTREQYDEVLRISQEAYQTGQSVANVLSLLTRMRQICLSRQLIPQSFFDDLRQVPEPVNANAIAISSISEEDRERLTEKLRQEVSDDADCAICFDAPMKNPRITDCGHCYCYQCIEDWLGRKPECAYCRHGLTLASLLELPPEEKPFIEPEASPYPPAFRSAKIEELIKYLKAFDTSDKTLVFSQFTSFLDILAGSLKAEGIQFCRFDGSMNAKQRQDVIAKFQRPVTAKNTASNPMVMLISLKSGAVGLNLTAASNVFLCDPWWQSAIEAQAIDRVHRMGQKKPVRVFQLIAADTIEAKVLDIQKRKDELVAKAFEKSSRGEKKKDKKQARYEEIRELLGLGRAGSNATR